MAGWLGVLPGMPLVVVVVVGALVGGVIWAPGASAATGRVYELVSGFDKNGGGVSRAGPVSDDGERLRLMTTAAPEGAHGIATNSHTVAVRTPAGWTHHDANAAAPPRVGLSVSFGVIDIFSADFTRAILANDKGFDPLDQNQQVDLYRLDVGTGRTTWVSHLPSGPDTLSRGVQLAGASATLDRVVFRSNPSHRPDEHAGAALQRWEEGKGVSIISRLPNGGFAANPRIAANYYQRSGLTPLRTAGVAVPHRGAHAVSDDASRIYFYDSAAGAGPLYLYDEGQTVLVSHAPGDPTATRDARFIGASHDGSIAYLASTEQLTSVAQPGMQLYRYDAETDELELLTVDPDAQASDTIDQALVSDDASTVYFVSTAALAGGAVRGQRNLYRWRQGETIRFITELGPGTPENNPNNRGDDLERVSRDGRYAVITSAAGAVNGSPTTGHASVHLYDDETGELSCASCRPDGGPSQGNARLDQQPQVSISHPFDAAPRNLTDDGVVYFNSDERLVPEDVNDAIDVYEYDPRRPAAERLRLISSGTSEFDSYLQDNSDDGRHVFFLARERLSPDDRDHVTDLYDAHLGGGFPARPVPPDCSDDGCQGAPPPPLTLLLPGSDQLTGDGNVPPVPEGPRPRPRILSVSIGTTATRELLRRGRTAIRVRVRGGGRITVRARGRLGRRTQTLAVGTRTVRRTSLVTARVPLQLSRAARRALRRGERLQLTIEARLSGDANAVRRSLSLAGRRMSD